MCVAFAKIIVRHFREGPFSAVARLGCEEVASNSVSGAEENCSVPLRGVLGYTDGKEVWACHLQSRM